ncbi:hypothetical protein GGR57DRAFT_499342 [Xylariaceae sp. FL1272]|nr:hypothetical protein GGR57DRAFT_499342 [Xylariaceae sp. FL1272]
MELDFFADSSLNLGHRVQAIVDLQRWREPYRHRKDRSPTGQVLKTKDFLDFINIYHARPRVRGAPGAPLSQGAGTRGGVAASGIAGPFSQALAPSSIHHARPGGRGRFYFYPRYCYRVVDAFEAGLIFGNVVLF